MTYLFVHFFVVIPCFWLYRGDCLIVNTGKVPSREGNRSLSDFWRGVGSHFTLIP